MPIYPFQFFDSQTVRARGVAALAQIRPAPARQPRRVAPGQNVELRAHRDYWGGAPRIDGVEFLIGRATTRDLVYPGDDLDIVWLQTDTARAAYCATPRCAGSCCAVGRADHYLGMNQNLYAPFRDKRVREAFWHRDRPAAMGTAVRRPPERSTANHAGRRGLQPHVRRAPTTRTVPPTLRMQASGRARPARRDALRIPDQPHRGRSIRRSFRQGSDDRRGRRAGAAARNRLGAVGRDRGERQRRQAAPPGKPASASSGAHGPRW